MKEEFPLISIIIPVYNAENFLDQCFESIMMQTYHNLEIIFVDDGSTDNSYRKCLEFVNRDGRVKAYTKKNGGQNSARKLGVENAKGKYIGFVDADDWIENTMYEKMYHKLKEYLPDIVICGLSRVYKDGRIVPQIANLSGIYEGEYVLEHIYNKEEHFQLNVPTNLVTTLMSKDLVEKSMYIIDERINYGEDYAWLAVACINSSRIYMMNESLYYYRKHENSFVRSHDKSNVVAQKILFENISVVFKQKDASKEVYKQLGYLIVCALLVGGYEYFLQKYDNLFPYNVPKKSKIIVYGAGTYGAEVYSKVKSNDTYDIVAQVDNNWQMYDSKSILPVERIKEFEFDFIVVAILSQSVSSQVKNQLIAMGINEQKIAIMDADLIENEVGLWLKG